MTCSSGMPVASQGLGFGHVHPSIIHVSSAALANAHPHGESVIAGFKALVVVLIVLFFTLPRCVLGHEGDTLFPCPGPGPADQHKQ
ncbi:hypothetical protein LIA77_02569 [Sarocladium implicatum]|nr:hypothetical protein LIA77_02569 [Sarocladium implicatum]